MATNEENVNQLRQEIAEQETKAKEAIKKGVVFEEVKKMTRYIKFLKSRLAAFLGQSKEHQQ